MAKMHAVLAINFRHTLEAIFILLRLLIDHAHAALGEFLDELGRRHFLSLIKFRYVEHTFLAEHVDGRIEKGRHFEQLACVGVGAEVRVAKAGRDFIPSFGIHCITSEYFPKSLALSTRPIFWCSRRAALINCSIPILLPFDAAKNAAPSTMFLIFPPESRNCLARNSKSTPSSRGASATNNTCQICRRCASPANGNSTINCRRRVNASSRFWRRFVARIVIPSYCSIFCSRYDVSMLAYRSSELLTSDRLPKSASASSKNSIALAFSAVVKMRSRFFSVSPMYLLTTPDRSIL